MTLVRRLVVPIVAFALAAYAALSIQVYRSTIDPEGFSETRQGTYSWIFGPSYRDLNRVARERLERAISVLNDTTLDATSRLDAYRDNLRHAETLLTRSLRANPAQPIVVSQVAAVRWELGQPLNEAGEAEVGRMIDVASQMAPTNPDVHFRLGTLLMRMGHIERGFAHLAEAMTLDPSRSNDAIEFLHDMLVPAPEIARRIPITPQALQALYVPYFEEGDGEEYLELASRLLETRSPIVLRYFGMAALRLHRAEELRTRLDELGELADPVAEAQRLATRANARVALSDSDGAMRDAREARSLAPKAIEIAENLGRVAVAAGQYEEGLRAYRDAMTLVARGSGDAPRRAWLYTLMGIAEEKRGRPENAYIDYKRAVELDPARRDAQLRIETMEGAPFE